MSRGPWKAETHARRNGGDGHGPLSNAQRTPNDHVEPWKDKRKEARAKVKAELDALRSSILWKVASQNRKEALARHAPRYIGHPCIKHDNAERYTVTGHCVVCAREIRDEVRGIAVKPRLDRKLRPTVAAMRKPVIAVSRGFDDERAEVS